MESRLEASAPQGASDDGESSLPPFQPAPPPASPRIKQEQKTKRARGAGTASTASVMLTCGVCEVFGSSVIWGSIGPQEADGSRGKPACQECFSTWQKGWSHRFTWSAIVEECLRNKQTEKEFMTSREVQKGVLKKDRQWVVYGMDHQPAAAPPQSCQPPDGVTNNASPPQPPQSHHHSTTTTTTTPYRAIYFPEQPPPPSLPLPGWYCLGPCVGG